MARSPFIVDLGWLEGRIVRTARKPGQCHNHFVGGKRCPIFIQPGDLYVEGDVVDLPFTRARYCLTCAGPEARESIAHRRPDLVRDGKVARPKVQA